MGKSAARRQEVSVLADGHVIKPSSSEKLLGGIISEDLKWKQHLLSHDQSLVKQLTSRLNRLLLISKRASVKTKLMVANGIFMSKMYYLVSSLVGQL